MRTFVPIGTLANCHRATPPETVAFGVLALWTSPPGSVSLIHVAPRSAVAVLLYQIVNVTRAPGYTRVASAALSSIRSRITRVSTHASADPDPTTWLPSLSV